MKTIDSYFTRYIDNQNKKIHAVRNVLPLKHIAFSPSDKVHSYSIINETLMLLERKSTGTQESPWIKNSFIEKRYPIYKTPFDDNVAHYLTFLRKQINRDNMTMSETIHYTVTYPKNEKPKHVILYAKGNTWDLGSFLRPFRPDPSTLVGQDEPNDNGEDPSLSQMIADATDSIIISFEYPGYGIEDPYLVDIVQAPLFMAQMIQEVSTKFNLPLILMGYSIGTAVTVHALAYLKAHNKNVYAKVVGMILQSPFASFQEIGSDHFIERIAIEFLKTMPIYNTDKIIHELDIPIIFLHGAKDTTCPVHPAFSDLYQAYNNSIAFYIQRHADHNTLPMFQMWYMQKLKESVNRLTYDNNRILYL